MTSDYPGIRISLTLKSLFAPPCTLPLRPPKGGTKRDFAVFTIKIQFMSIEVCCKVVV